MGQLVDLWMGLCYLVVPTAYTFPLVSDDGVLGSVTSVIPGLDIGVLS